MKYFKRFRVVIVFRGGETLNLTFCSASLTGLSVNDSIEMRFGEDLAGVKGRLKGAWEKRETLVLGITRSDGHSTDDISINFADVSAMHISVRRRRLYTLWDKATWPLLVYIDTARELLRRLAKRQSS